MELILNLSSDFYCFSFDLRLQKTLILDIQLRNLTWGWFFLKFFNIFLYLIFVESLLDPKLFNSGLVFLIFCFKLYNFSLVKFFLNEESFYILNISLSNYFIIVFLFLCFWFHFFYLSSTFFYLFLIKSLFNEKSFESFFQFIYFFI